MIYTHLLNCEGKEVRSPMDALQRELFRAVIWKEYNTRLLSENLR